MDALTYIKRIEPLIASQTEFSRRQVDDLLKAGRVALSDGALCKPGQKIDLRSQTVLLDGLPLAKKSKKLVYLYHKPKGLLTTMDDPKNRATIAPVVRSVHPSLFPVGRLDKETSGLLILTNDGDVAHRLLHPKFEVQKTYLVTTNKDLKNQDMDWIKSGVILEDGPVLCKGFAQKSKTQFKLSISEGRNRIVRRLFEFFGVRVEKLHRIQVGEYALGDLAEGAVGLVSKVA